MSVRVQCPNPECGASLTLPDEALGRRGRCPRCRTSLVVPASTDGPSSARVDPLATTSARVDPSGKTSTPRSAPPERLGRYEIREKLGSGAFGTVYRAYDPLMDREVALKVPREGLLETPSAVKRFLREAQAAARLRHPHIVTAFDAGSEDGRYYIATAFVRGRTLAHAIGEEGLEPRLAARVVRELAGALQHAHELGIVHRDVKPANVMLDPEGHAHLMDFGLARLSGSESARLTQVGSILGTPAYMAPEQATGLSDEADPASDQYSLGVTLFELLTGQTPFVGPIEIVLYATIHQPPPTLSSFNPAVPVDLESICLKTLAKKPVDRYAHCRELADDLGRWLDGRPVTSRPKGPDPPIEADPSLLPADLLGLALDVDDSLLAGDDSRGSKKPGRPRGFRPRRAVIGLAALPVFAIGVVGMFASSSRRPPSTSPSPSPSTGSGSTPAGRPASTRATAPGPSPAVGPVSRPEPVESASTSVDPPLVPGQSIGRGFVNSVGMEFTTIPAGEFLMGASPGDIDAVEIEKPPHRTKISKAFQMGIFEVTQGEYQAVMGRNPSFFSTEGGGKERVKGRSTARHPVESVSWSDALEFCNALSLKERLRPCYRQAAGGTVVFEDPDTSPGYRLPTEAEWEYACRAGGTARYSFGDDPAELDRHAWAGEGDLEGATHPVGGKTPNAFGLHDIHGNVWEWCWDLFDENYYKTAPAVDPLGPGLGVDRTYRGGAWRTKPVNCRASGRSKWGPGYDPRVYGEGGRANNRGFRVVRTVRAGGLSTTSGASVRMAAYAEKLASSRRTTQVAVDFARAARELDECPADARGWEWDYCRRFVARGGNRGSGGAMELGSKGQPITCVAFSPDGRLLASNREGGIVTVWDAASGRPLGEIRGKTGSSFSVDFGPGSSELAVPEKDGTITLWDVKTRQPSYVLRGHKGPISHVDFRPGRNEMVTAGDDSTARIWDLDARRQRIVLAGHTKKVRRAIYDRTGARVATQADDHSIRIWDAEDGHQIFQFDPKAEWIRSLAYSPDGARLAAAVDDNLFKVWDASDGRELLTLRGHSGIARTVTFHPDGRRIATGSLDGTIRIWDADSGQNLLTLAAHTDGVYRVAFSPDGRRLASCGFDGLVRIWESAR